MKSEFHFVALAGMALISCTQKGAPGNCVSSVDNVAPAWHDAGKYSAAGGYFITRAYSDSSVALAAALPPDEEYYTTAHFEFRKEGEKRWVRVYSSTDSFFSGMTPEVYAKVYWNGGYFDLHLRDPLAARHDAFRSEGAGLNSVAGPLVMSMGFDPYWAINFWSQKENGVAPQAELGKEWCSVDGSMKSSLRSAPNNRCIPFQYMGVREYEIPMPIPLGIAQRLDEMEDAARARRQGSRLSASEKALMEAWDQSFDEVNRKGREYTTALFAALLHKCSDNSIELPVPGDPAQAWSTFCSDKENTAQVVGKFLNADGKSLATISMDGYRQSQAALRAALKSQADIYVQVMDRLQRDRSLIRIESNFFSSDILGGAKPAFLSLPVAENLPALAGLHLEMDGRIPWLTLDLSKMPAAKVAEFAGTMIAVDGAFPFVSFTTTEVTNETNGFPDFMLPVRNNGEDNRRAATVTTSARQPAPPTGSVPGAVTAGGSGVPAAVDASVSVDGTGRPRKSVPCP